MGGEDRGYGQAGKVGDYGCFGDYKIKRHDVIFSLIECAYLSSFHAAGEGQNG